MTTFGRIPFALRPPLQLLLGLAMLALPFALGVGLAGTVLSVLAGTLAVGVALGSTVTERGVSPMPLTTVQSFDWSIALGLFGASLVLAFGGLRDAAVLLAAFGAAHLLLTLTTRWSLRA